MRMLDKAFEIEEIGTERYGSLEDARQAALGPLAQALVDIIRSGLDNGDYIVQDGLVKLREEADHE